MVSSLLKAIPEIKDHKIVGIPRSIEEDGCMLAAYWLQMDCHVQPEKIVVYCGRLQKNKVFDPHFSNGYVVARFPTNPTGWEMAVNLIYDYDEQFGPEWKPGDM